MAILVCYSRTPPHDEHREKAIYLQKQFYEAIVASCRPIGSGFEILGDIASLKYEGRVIDLAGSRLNDVMEELERLGALHPELAQVTELRKVCVRAVVEGVALKISGDMYPEL